MRVVLLNRYRLINGTQTMILRMARALAAKGHEPVFVRFNNKPVDLLEEIARYARVVFLKELLDPEAVRQIGKIDAIYCYTEDTLVRMLYYANTPCDKIIFGLFHTRQYQTKVIGGYSFLNHLYTRLFRLYPKKNIIFMTDGVRQECEKYFRVSMAESNVLPLPIDIPGSYIAREGVNRRKIISIARLVEFKNYHPPVIEFVVEQRRKGVLYQYDIYGDGPLFEELQKLIVQLGATDFVHLHGPIPYEKMAEVLRDAGVAVGMGTALVEAAAQGIPAIGAIEMRGRECHGWFHQTDRYDVGEQISVLPRFTITSILNDYCSWDDEQYRHAGCASWRRAGDFSSETMINRFIDIVAQASNVRSRGIRVSQLDWWRFWAAKAFARYFTLPGFLHK